MLEANKVKHVHVFLCGVPYSSELLDVVTSKVKHVDVRHAYVM
jgi:hypothetical protein